MKLDIIDGQVNLKKLPNHEEKMPYYLVQDECGTTDWNTLYTAPEEPTRREYKTAMRLRVVTARVSLEGRVYGLDQIVRSF